MAPDFKNTVYGPISRRYAASLLGDLCMPDAGVQTGPFGSQLHASDYVDQGTPIITVEHLGENRIIHADIPHVGNKDKERLSKYTLKTGDIVFSRVGFVDRRAIVHPDEDGWLFSGRCLRVRPDREKIDPGYLSWFLGSPGFKEHIRQIAVGATMPSLNTTILSKVVVYYPPSIREQQAIAHILGTMDDKIELNRKMNETLETMAKAIFKSWFVDFDPVRAKAGGREPDGMDSKTAALFPNSFKPSKLGKIPEEWDVKGFDQIVEILSGGTPKTSVDAYWGGDIPWFTVKDAPKGGDIFVMDTEKYITQAGVDNSATKILPVGTTIISARGTVGKLAMVWRPMAMNQTCYGLRGKKGYPDSYIYFQTKALVEDLKHRTHGCVFDTIIRDTFKTLEIAAPTSNIVQAFNAKVEPILQMILSNLKQSRTLAAIRDALLPRLISGEVRVQHPEQFLEALA